MTQELRIEELLKQAEEYLKTDCNASAIKQGMVLESICREYLNCTLEINQVRNDGRDPTLNDMVFYLRKVGIITNSGNSDLCERIRRNRNSAVHQFRRLNSEAKSTLPSLKNLVQNLSARINMIASPPSDIADTGFVMDNHIPYSAGKSYTDAFAKAFIELLKN